MREQTMRRCVAVGALLCWAASITLVLLLLVGAIRFSPDIRPAFTTMVVLIQSLAVTLSVIGAQLRYRRVVVDVLRTGMAIDGWQRQQEQEKTEKENSS